MGFSRFIARVFTLVILFLTGCGPKEAPLLKVSGTVAVDGVPVEYGYISFIPLDEGFGPQAGPITNGSFEFPARPGPMRVEIRATRPVKGTISRIEYIPARFNKESTLTEDVSEHNRRFEFKLSEK
jgi:hypothetical protein